MTLGGALVRFHPDGATAGGKVALEIDEAQSIRQVLDTLRMPTSQPVMVIHNGELIQPDDRHGAIVSAGDTLSLVPPIQAG